MHGKSNMSRNLSSQKLHRKIHTVTSGDTVRDPAALLDVGDWALAQDEDGALIIHNVVTGNRVVIATP